MLREVPAQGVEEGSVQPKHQNMNNKTVFGQLCYNLNVDVITLLYLIFKYPFVNHYLNFLIVAVTLLNRV